MRLYLGCAAVLALSDACSPGGTTNDAGTTDATIDVEPIVDGGLDSTTDAEGETKLKPVCQGVMPEDYAGDAAAPSAYSFMIDTVVQLQWAALQIADADAGNAFPAAAWQPLEDALADPNVQGIRLRVLAGIHAPPFVKSMGGFAVSGQYNNQNIDCSAGGIAVVDPAGNVTTGCVPAFWTKPVLDVYGQLLTHIANTYGSKSKLREVVDSACMTVYAEPFVRGHGEPGTIARLHAAGFDINQDIACESAVITMFSGLTPFAQTRLSLALSDWDEVLPDGGFTTAWADTASFAMAQRAILGPRLVLQINHLNPGYTCDGGKPEECFMANLAPPKGAQTWSWAQLVGTGDGQKALDDSIQQGVNLGLDYVEVPTPQYETTDAGSLHVLHDALVANDAGP